MNKEFVSKFWPVIVLVAALFAAAVVFRPVLPIDETRYMTVAWELFLHHDYSLPTLNFEPYHHKPPLLFFLIDSTWDVFGVSRWAALIPFFIFAIAHIFMTRALAKRLFPQNDAIQERLPYLSVASFPFMIYSTVIMFDIMLTVWVLGFFLMALSNLDKPKLWKMVLGGVFLGLGGLTKGPVVLIYTFLPLAALVIWEKRAGLPSVRGVWTKWFAVSFAAGIALVMVWLLDLYFEIGPEFFHTLLFTQTIDRINGKMESSHARPFYFYLPLIPVLFLPWLCFPAFWRNAKAVLQRVRSERGVRLAVLWFCGCTVVFMLISGKQPHYLVPLLPAVLLFIALCLEKASLRAIKMTALAMVVIVCAGQAVAEKYFFDKYDLTRFAQIVADNPEHDWAFVRKYQGELGFLGRINRHIDSLEFHEMDLWFKQHPDGYMIVRHHPEQDILKYHQVFNMEYRSRYLGIFTLNDKIPPPKNLPLAEQQ